MSGFDRIGIVGRHDKFVRVSGPGQGLAEGHKDQFIARITAAVKARDQ